MDDFGGIPVEDTDEFGGVAVAPAVKQVPKLPLRELQASNPSLFKKLQLALPGLLSTDEDITGQPKGLLPKFGNVAGSLLFHAPLAASTYDPEYVPQGTMEGVAHGIAKQVNLGNLLFGLGLGKTLTSTALSKSPNIARAAVSAPISYQGIESVLQEAPRVVDPSLTPGERGEAGFNTLFGLGMAGAPLAMRYVPEPLIKKTGLNPAEITATATGRREAQQPPYVIGQQPASGLVLDAEGNPVGVQFILRPIQQPAVGVRPPVEEGGGGISFASPAEAGGIPSAGQAATGKSTMSEQEALMRGNFIPAGKLPEERLAALRAQKVKPGPIIPPPDQPLVGGPEAGRPATAGDEFSRQGEYQSLYGRQYERFKTWIGESKDILSLEGALKSWQNAPFDDRRAEVTKLITDRLVDLQREQGMGEQTMLPSPKIPPGSGLLGTVHENLTEIGKSTSPLNKIAAELSKLGDEAGLKVPVYSSKLDPGTLGEYRPSLMGSPESVHVADYLRGEEAQKTLVHEALHAFVWNKTDPNIRYSYKQGDAAIQEYLRSGKDQPTKQLIQTYLEAKRVLSPKGQGMYGMTDYAEFISEAWSNPKFQEFLQKEKSIFGGSLWDRMVKAVKRMLGLNVEDTLLADVIRISSAKVKEPRPPSTGAFLEKEPVAVQSEGETQNARTIRSDQAQLSSEEEQKGQAALQREGSGGTRSEDIQQHEETGQQAGGTGVSRQDVDAAYLDAVGKGDLKTAQKLVDQAANEAGYVIEGFHGSPIKGIETFYPKTHFGSKEQALPVSEEGELYHAYLKIKNPKRTPDLHDKPYWTQAAIKARKEGHDAIVYKNIWESPNPLNPQDSYLVFDPNQIKSAEPITRDSQGNIIPLSQRFSPKSSSRLYGGIPFLDPELYKGLADSGKSVVKGLGKLYERLNEDRQTISKSFIRHQTKSNIAATRDTADNAAFGAGIQAENALKMEGQKIFGLSNPSAQAAVTVINEAKGNKAMLPKFLAQATAAGHEEAIKAVKFAQANWSQLQPLVKLAKALDEQNQQVAVTAGIDIPTIDHYIKRIYETPRGLLFKGFPATGTGKSSKLARHYETIFDAIENGEKPASLDASALVGKRTTEIQMDANLRNWADLWKRVEDPATKSPVMTELQANGMAPRGYDSIEILPGKRVAVLKGYRSIFNAVTGHSIISDTLPGQFALGATGALKHSLLMFDSFHMFRIWQFGKSLGVEGGLLKAGRKGLSILEYRPQDLAEAVKQGEVPQEALQYVNEKVQTPQGTKTRREIAFGLMKSGLNIGRHSEALYTNMVRSIPVLGDFNRFVFDKMSRGVMMEAGQIEFERLANARPDLTHREIFLMVSRDLNFRMGNLGRQGIFKSKTMQDALTIPFLAPRWVEAMAQTEVRSVGQTARALIPGTKEFGTRRTLARSSGNLLAAYVIGTQMLNWMTTGHTTFDNPEGHNLDAFVPVGEQGFWISPLSVAAELSHDMIRLGAKGSSVAESVAHIAANKLGPVGRATKVLASGDTFRGHTDDTWERVKRASVELVPAPLPIQSGFESAKKGTTVPAVRQAFALGGIKAEPETRTEVEERQGLGKTVKERVLSARTKKAEMTPRTREEDVQASQYAVKIEAKRAQAVEDKLPADQRAWLKKNELKIPPHENRIHIPLRGTKGQDITLTGKELQEYEQHLQENYSTLIAKMMQKGDMEKLPYTGRKDVFNKAMAAAADRARSQVKAGMKKK